LHPGHVFFFEEAKKYGDVLIVSPGSDRTIRFLKGRDRPVLNQNLRAKMIAALEVVDCVVVDNEKIKMPGKINFEILVKTIRPDVFAVNNTDSAIREKRSLVARHGAHLILVDVTKGPDISTTKIIEKIKSS
jgi:D-beta-D-heptose 7-phosphate kinase/D-beta-D-heptose 1-phosphate adenosyltransferase